MRTKKTLGQNHHQFKLRCAPLVALLAFAGQSAMANPMDATVVSGQASFATTGNTLTVVNTPGTIINWQSFSIGQSEITNFVQQSASSAVLNRVIGNDPSNILGTLQSNGRVFLINPHGIAFGAGSVVDVAGLVASTLNISDADFQAGRYNFTAVPGAQNVSNAGNITAQDNGQIYLIAPNVENSGVITAPNGEIYLAAGSSVELVNSNDPNLRVSITAPAGDATNVGQLIASSGNLGLFGTVVRNSGTVSADSATMQGGRIVFRASERTEISGTVTANGTTGGEIKALGNEVGIMDGASITANGTQGGGTVLIGGDYQGGNPDVQNAQITYVAPTASISADATDTGDGGRIIVWSDNTTRAYGDLSVRGGANGGDGGFIETSGHYLDVAGIRIDTAALNGAAGAWLLDPWNVTITATADAGGTFTAGVWTPSATGSTITAATILAALDAGTAVTVTTTGVGAEAGNITVSAPIAMTGVTATSLTLQAAGSIAINQNITSANAPLDLVLDHGAAGNASIATGVTVNLAGGLMDVQKSGAIAAGTLSLTGTLANATLNATGLTSNSGTLNNVTIGSSMTESGALWIGNNLLLADGVNFNTGASTIYFSAAAANIGLAAGATAATLTHTGGLYANGSNNSGVVTIASGVTVQGSGGLYHNYSNGGWVNNGTILNNTAGTLSISPTNFTNNGTLSATSGATNITSTNLTLGTGNTLDVAGGTLTINPTNAWSNSAGNTSISAGVLNLGSSFTLTSLGTYTRSGGTVNITGTLDLLGSATPLDLSGAGQFGIGGLGTLSGTLINGTITGTMLSSSNGALIDITIGSSMTESGTLWIGNNLLLADGVNLNTGASTVYFSAAAANIGLAAGATAATLTHTGGLYANGSNNSGVVTIASGVTVQGSGALSHNYSNGGWVNNGTILNNTAGTLSISPTNFTNNGTLSATSGTTNITSTNLTLGTGNTLDVAGGTLTINPANAWSNAAGNTSVSAGVLNLGSSFTLASLGTYTRSGGTVNITGTLDLLGSATPLDLSGAGQFGTGGLGTLSGTLINGTITGTTLSSSSGTLNNITIGSSMTESGTLWIGNNLLLSDGVNFNTGASTVYFSAAAANIGLAAGATAATLAHTGGLYANGSNNSGVVTIASGVTVQGSGALSHNYSNGGWVNNGIILNNTAGTLSIYPTNFTNNGTLSATSGTLNINPTTFTNSVTGTISYGTGTVGTINPTNFSNAGALTFGGTTFTLAPTTSYSNTGTVAFNTGTINLGGVFPYADLTSPNYTRAAGVVVNQQSGLNWNLGGGTFDLDTGVFGGKLNSMAGMLITGTITGTTLTSSSGGLIDITIGNSMTESGTLWIGNNLLLADGVNFNTGASTVYFSAAAANIGLAAGATAATLTHTGGLYANGSNNSGVVTIASGVTVQGSGALGNSYGNGGWVNNGTILNNTAGTLSIYPTNFTNNGTLSATSGTLNINPTTFTNSVTGTISYGTGTVGTINPTNFSNAGALTFGGTTFTLAPTTSYNNTGTMAFNSGTVNLGGVFPYADLTSLNYTRMSGVTVNQQSGVLWNLGGGLFDLDTGVWGSKLNNLAGTLITGTITGTTLTSSSGALIDITIGSNLTESGTLWIGNNLLLADGVNFNTGASTVYFSAAAANIGLAAGATAATLTHTGGLYANGLNNSGVVTIASGVTVQGSGGLYNNYGNGGWVNNGTILNNTAGTLTISPTNFTNNGTLSATSGTLNVSATNFSQAGSIEIASGATFTRTTGFTNNGSISGAGTVNLGTATLTNNGSIDPGIATGDNTGTLSITGNLVMGATGQVNLDVNSSAAGDHDLLRVSGTATLTNGTLNLAGAGSPDELVLLTAVGGLGGTQFATINAIAGMQSPQYLSRALAFSNTNFSGLTVWTGGANTLGWETSGNWDSNAVPTAASNLYIMASAGNVNVSTGAQSANSLTDMGNLFLSGGTLSLAGASILNTLTLSGGTLAGAGAVDIVNGLTWNSGTLNRTGMTTVAGNSSWTSGWITGGVLTNTGTLTFTGSADSGMNGATAELRNSGTIIYSKTGGALFAFGGILSNLAGGVVDLQSDASLFGWGGTTGVINNAGTFTKTSGSSISVGSTISFNHQNGSTMNVQPGSDILLNGGGSFTGTSTGTGVGATLNGGNWSSAGGMLAGMWQWDGGWLNSGVLSNVGTLTFGGAADGGMTGATTELRNSGTIIYAKTGGAIFDLGGILSNLVGGVVDLQSDAMIFGWAYRTGFINNAGTFTKTLGTSTALHGAITLTNTGIVRVQSGNLTAPTLSTNDGVLDIWAGATFTDSTGFINNGTLTGAGTIVLGTGASKLVNQGIIAPGGIGAAGTLAISGDVQLSTGSDLQIELAGQGAGQFDVLAVSGAVSGNTGSFGSVNASSLGNYYATGTETFTVLTAASGLDSATFATLNYTDALLAATYAPGSARLDIAGLLFTLWNTDLSGDWANVANWSNGLPTGTIRAVIDRTLANPTVTISSAVTAASLEVGSGDVVSIAAGGDLTLNGTSSFTNGAVLDISGGILQGPGSVDVGGNLSILNGTIASTGLFNTTGPSAISGNALVNGTTWNNSGALLINGSGSLTLDNGAIFNNLSAGSFTLNTSNPNAIAVTAGGGSFNNTGTFNNNGTTATSINSLVAYSNTGMLNVNAGSLTYNGALTQSGTLHVASGATFTDTSGFTNTGVLSGAGTIVVGANTAGLINQGTINPGGTNATGTLTINGDLKLDTGSIMNIDLAGISPGQFDSVAVNGAVSGDALASFGTVNVSEMGSYLVPAGAGYAVLTATSGADSASFATVNFSDAALTTTYAPGSATLNVGQLFYTLWNVDANGDWSVASNWSNGLPSAAVRAIIDRGPLSLTISFNSIETARSLTISNFNSLDIQSGTLTLNEASTVAADSSLMLTGGTLVDNAGLTVDGNLIWSGGSVLTGAGLLTTSSTAVTGIIGTTFLSDKSWDNAGLVNITGGGVLQMDGAGSNAFTNQAGGVVNLYGSYALPIVDWAGFNRKVFNNAGTLNKQTGSITTQTLNLVFNNSGVVNVNEGMLALANSGTDSGIYNIGAGMALDLTGGVRIFDTGSALNNSGYLSNSGANTSLIGSYSGSGGLSVTGGGFYYASANALAPSSLNLSGGILTLNIGTTTSAMTFSGGTLTGTGDLTLAAGSSSWSAGTMSGSGALIVNSGASLGMGSAVSQTLDRALINNGSVTMDFGASLTGTGSIQNNGQFSIVNALTIAPAFTNAAGAILTKYFDTGVTTFSGAFSNAGTVNVDSGTLAFSGGGADTGTYNVASGATLQFSGGTRNLNAGTQLFVDGGLVMSGGTVNFNTGSDVLGAGSFVSSGNAVANINGGFSLAATGTVTLSSSGTVSFNVPLTFANTFTISTSPVTTLGGSGDLVMNGAFNWLSGSDIGGTGTLTTNGVTTMSSPSDLTVMWKHWINNGTVNFESNGHMAVGTSGLVWTNSNTGVMNFNGTTTAPLGTWSGSGSQFINQGTINKPVGSAVTQTIGDAGLAINNASGGIINIDSGTLAIGGAYTQAGTVNLAAGATLSRAAGIINTGVLSGFGTIAVGTGAAALVNRGSIVPGGSGSTGTLAISGDLMLDTGSNLDIELGGTAAGQFDNIAVSGAVSGNTGSFGGLTLTKINGYTVTTGDTFSLISAASGINTAAFDPFTMTGVSITPSYAVNDFSLSMTTGLTLLITADALSKVYGTADPALTYVATGFAAGDSAATILSGGLLRVTGENVGTYAIDQGSLIASSGYNISYVGDVLTITAAPLTVVADAQLKIYGDADPTLTYVASGFVNGDTVASLSGSLNRVTGQNVGSYAINQGTLNNPNYTITYTGSTLSITQRDITVALNAISKTYGSADNLASGISVGGSGLASWDNVNTAFTGSLSRVGGETVVGGPYLISQGTLAANANYNLTGFTGNSLTITPATLNVTANSLNKTYGDTVTFLGAEFISTGLKFGETIGSATLSSAGAVSTASVAGGPYPILIGNATGGTFDPANYTINYVNGTLTVDPAPVSLLSVTANDASKTYGTTLTFNGTEFTPVGLVGADTISSVTLTSAGTVDTAAAGTYAITPSNAVFSVGNASNYTITYVDGVLTVNPAALTITADLQSKIYGNADPVLTYTVSGLLFSDTLSGSLGRVTGENVGTYAISQGSLGNANYTVTFNGSNLSITPRDISIAADAANKVYGSADPALTYTVGGMGLASWDSNATAFTGGLTRVTGENVGDYAISQGTLLTANANYTITGFTGNLLSITPAGLLLSITANDASKTYGTTLTFAGTEFTPVGLTNGDTISGVTLSSAGAVNNAGVGSYAITPSNAVFSVGSAANYSITYVDGVLTVNPATLSVTANLQNKVYGSADPALSYVASGLLFGDTLSGSLSRVTGENVGSYAINQGTLANPNYNISYTGNTLNITPASLSVTANDFGKTYDAVAYSGGNGVTYSGFVNGETSAVLGGVLSYGGTSQGAVNAGSYTITPGGLTAGNYSISYVNGTLTITPAALTLLSIAANDASKTYGTTLTFAGTEFTPVGLLGGDVISGVTLTSAGAVATANAGTYAITPSNAVFSAGSASNYDISYVDGLLTVNPAALTVTANAVSKIYGDADPALSYTTTGLLFSDTLSGSLGRVTGENVGAYAIDQGTLSNANYTISYTGNNLSITPATLTIIADDVNKVMTTADPLLTYTVQGLKLTDTAASTVSGSLIRESGETVGTYQIGNDPLSPLTVTSSNYLATYTYVPGTFTILAASGVIGEIVEVSAQNITLVPAEEEQGLEEVVLMAGADVTEADNAAQPLPVCN